MINQIYLIEFQLNKAITSDTKAPCLGLHLSISNDTRILQNVKNTHNT